MIRKLILKNRSYRRFDTSVRIERQQIEKWIDLARISASAGNMQPLKYMIVNDEKQNINVFSNLSWAGYLKKWEGPSEEERPVAYIIVLHDLSISKKCFCDDGIAIQSILLGAVDDGFGGCIIGTINKDKLRKNFSIPENFKILYVLALGKPIEKVVLESVEKSNIKYWRDENEIHHVPKRPLLDIIYR